MKKISHFEWGEIVFSSSDSAKSQAIRRAVQSQQLRKLAPRIYTTNLSDAPATIIKRNQYHILGELFPGAILSHRTALEGGPTKEGVIFLSYKYTKKITLPGLTARLLAAPPTQTGDTIFMGKLYIASRARALLENLQPARGVIAKCLNQADVEGYLDKICVIHGSEELNTIRDQARQLAPKLKLTKEFKKLDRLVGAILQTRSNEILASPSAKARALGKPYDVARIALFADLATKLTHAILPIAKSPQQSQQGLQHLAFFEAYFSNYIEGTEFEVEEAAEIIFHHKIIPNRPEDAHDIIGTYRIVVNPTEMTTTPGSPAQLIQLLKKRHQILMSVRKDKSPGEFKQLANRAGNTTFVQPELVIGTLEKAFELYHNLVPGIKRALFMMFLVTEIHPFDDGNGRIAHIMMNAELVAAAENRIIIPTVYREDYLLALRRLSRSSDPVAYITMLTRAQAFTASIDFEDYEQALQQLRQTNAFMQPFEGKLNF